MTQDNIIKLVVTLVAITLLCVLQNVINTKRNHRGRQALLPCIAFVFGIVATIVLAIRYDWAQSICDEHDFLKNGNVV